jgi:hypothetical protein
MRDADAELDRRRPAAELRTHGTLGAPPLSGYTAGNDPHSNRVT